MPGRGGGVGQRLGGFRGGGRRGRERVGRARRVPYAVAVGGAGRGRGHGAGQAPGHGLLDGAGQCGGVAHALVGEQVREPARVPLPHGPDLPGVLATVELQGADRRLGVEAGERERGDLLAVEPGDGDEGGGDGAEPRRRAVHRGQGEQHGDPVDVLGQGLQVDGEPVVGRRLPGDVEAGELGRAGVGDPLGAAHRAPVVAEGGPGDDGRAGRHPDLQAGLGQGVVLPPDQFGRHCVVPLDDGPRADGGGAVLVPGAVRVFRAGLVRCRWCCTGGPGRCGAGRWCCAGVPRADLVLCRCGAVSCPGVVPAGRRRGGPGGPCPRGPPPPRASPPARAEPTGAAGWRASGPGRYGRWPGSRGPSSASRRPSGAPSP
ncbi:hypothetical protein SCALM49S_08949 [Streptomyces californicus]